MRRLREQCFCFLALAALVCSPAHAQDSKIAGSTVLVAVDSQGEDAQTVRRVVLASIEVYLEQQGLVAIRAEGQPEDGQLSRAVAREARTADADFVVQGLLSVEGNTVQVDLHLYLVEGLQQLSRAAVTEPIGLTLDRAIAGLTGSVIEQARPYLVAAAEAAADSDSEAPAARRPPVAGAGPTEDGRVTPPAVSRNRLFSLEVNYAPFFPIDRAGDYIATTFSGASLTLLSMPFRSDVIGLGISARGMLAEATGTATNAALELFPIGIAVRVSGNPEPFAPYLRVTGGAAFLRATNDVLGAFTSVVPHASGELGMRMEVLDGYFGLQVFVGFDAVLESSLWILGFSPGLGLALGI